MITHLAVGELIQAAAHKFGVVGPVPYNVLGNSEPRTYNKRVPKYPYTKVAVLCYNSQEYDLADPQALRKAVEHLRSLDHQTKCTGIVAEAIVPAGELVLRARPFLQLHEIEGHKPSEVWSMFDAIVDRDRNYLINRVTANFGRGQV